MVAFGILGFLVGAVLAGRFRVFVLIPITLLAFLVALTVELIAGSGFPSAVGFCLAISVAPQFGYAFGLLVRYTIASQRFSRKAHVELAAKASLRKGA